MPSRWDTVIVVCRKCEKKLGGGFGPDGRQRLSKLLKTIGGGKGRKARVGVIESKCLKLCPKRAVTVVNGAHPHDWHVVQAGTSLDDLRLRLAISLPPDPSG